MFHSFFSSLARSKFLSLSLVSFIFTLVCWNSKIHKIANSLFLLILGLVFLMGLGHLIVSQNPREFYESQSVGLILVCAYTIWLYGQISIYCTIPSGSIFPTHHTWSCTPFVQFSASTYYVINYFLFIYLFTFLMKSWNLQCMLMFTNLYINVYMNIKEIRNNKKY